MAPKPNANLVLLLLQLKFGHGIEKFGEMFRHFQRLISVRENVQEVVRGCEIEPGREAKQQAVIRDSLVVRLGIFSL